MRTAHFSDWGGLPTETPLDRDPLDRDPLDRDPCPMPGQKPLEGTWDQGQRPLEGTRNQAVRQEVSSYRYPLSPHGQNDRHMLKHYPATNFVCGR